MHKITQIAGIIGLILSFLSCKNAENKEQTTEKPATTTEKSASNPEESPQADQKEVSPAVAESISRGEEVYSQNCAVCHQQNGGGVPNLNPPLRDADYTLGEKEPLIALLLQGSADKRIEVNGKTYSNVMPSFKSLDDAQIANVLTYIRNSFGNQASAVSTEEVASLRSELE